jgi:two-component system response regulator AtoC
MGGIHASEVKGKSGMCTLPPEQVIFGQSPAMRTVRQRVQKIAGANIPVLIQGAGGTGKEVLARWIHAHSGCDTGEFVKVSCAAIPGTLLESEMFGYEKGAFTGAVTSKPGRVELANKGTLYLDDIADLNLSLQSKLLHFLQDGCFSRIGDCGERTVDTRVICATHKNLEEEIEAGRFRADLYYRINVMQLYMPRLCERSEDIPILAEFFRSHHMKQFAKESEPFGSRMMGYLQDQPWPGNIRELSNEIARYVLMGPENTGLPKPLGMPMGTISTTTERRVVSLKRIGKEVIREVERKLIVEALQANQWNRRKAATKLKISYRALIYKMRESGIVPKTSVRVSEKRDPTVFSG